LEKVSLTWSMFPANRKGRLERGSCSYWSYLGSFGAFGRGKTLKVVLPFVIEEMFSFIL